METTTNKQPAVAVADVQPLYLGASSDEKAPTKCDACFVASDAATRAPSSGHSPRHSTLTLALVAAGAALAGGGLSTLARELGGLGGTCAGGGDQAALSPRGVGGGGLGDDGITFESTRAAEVLGELSSAEVQAVASYFVEATGISASRSLSGATQASGPVVVGRRKRPRGGGCLPALPSGPPPPPPLCVCLTHLRRVARVVARAQTSWIAGPSGVELLAPPKADALAYLDGGHGAFERSYSSLFRQPNPSLRDTCPLDRRYLDGGADALAPARWARVTVAAVGEDAVVEYKVGPPLPFLCWFDAPPSCAFAQRASGVVNNACAVPQGRAAAPRRRRRDGRPVGRDDRGGRARHDVLQAADRARRRHGARRAAARRAHR